MSNKEDRYGLSAVFEFELGANALTNIKKAEQGLRNIEEAVKRASNLVKSSELNQGMKAAFQSAGVAASQAANSISKTGGALNSVSKALQPLKGEFRALRAESRNIEFGDVTDPQAFRQAKQALREYILELEKLESQVQGNSAAEREFKAQLQSAKRVAESKIDVASGQRDAARFADLTGKAQSVKSMGQSTLNFFDEPLEKASEFSQELAGIQKLADFGAQNTDAAMKKLSDSILSQSVALATNRDEVSGIYESLAGAGKSFDNLSAIQAESNAILENAKALDISTEAATNLDISMGKVYQNSLQAFGGITGLNKSAGSAINALSDNLANVSISGEGVTRTFAELVSFIGDAQNFKPPDIAAFAAVMNSIGVAPSEATSFVGRLDAAIAQNTGAFAEALGMTVDEFADNLNRDKFGTYQKFITAFSKVQGGDIEKANFLSRMGIGQSGDQANIKKMASSLTVLTDARKVANQAFKEATSTTKELERVQASGNFQTQKAALALEAVKTQMGVTINNALLPFKVQMATLLQGVLKFAQEHPKLTSAVATGAYAFAILAVVLGTASVAFFGLRMAIAESQLAMALLSKTSIPLTGFFQTSMTAIGQQGLAGALMSLSSGFTGLGTTISAFATGAMSVLLNPITLTIAAVLGLYAAVEYLTPGFNVLGAVLSAITAPLGFVFGLVKGIAEGIFSGLKPAIDVTTTALSPFTGALQNAFGGIGEAINIAIKSFNAIALTGEAVGQTIGRAITMPFWLVPETVNLVITSIKGLWSLFASWLTDLLLAIPNTVKSAFEKITPPFLKGKKEAQTETQAEPKPASSLGQFMSQTKIMSQAKSLNFETPSAALTPSVPNTPGLSVSIPGLAMLPTPQIDLTTIEAKINQFKQQLPFTPPAVLPPPVVPPPVVDPQPVVNQIVQSVQASAPALEDVTTQLASSVATTWNTQIEQAALTPVGQVIKVGVEPLIGQLKQRLGGVFELATNFSTQFVDAIGGISKHLSGLTFGVGLFGVASLGAFSPVLLLLGGIALAVLAVTTNFLGLRTIVGGLIQVVSSLGRGIYEVIQGFVQTARGILQLFSSVGAAIRGDFTAIQGAAHLAFSGILRVGEGVAKALTGVFRGAIQVVEGIFQGLESFIRGSFGALAIVFKTPAASLEFVGKTGQAVFHFIEAAASSAANLMTSVLSTPEAAWKGFMALLGQIEAKFKSLVSSVSSAPSKAVEAVKSKFGFGRRENANPANSAISKSASPEVPPTVANFAANSVSDFTPNPLVSKTFSAFAPKTPPSPTLKLPEAPQIDLQNNQSIIQSAQSTIQAQNQVQKLLPPVSSASSLVSNSAGSSATNQVQPPNTQAALNALNDLEGKVAGHQARMLSSTNQAVSSVGVALSGFAPGLAAPILSVSSLLDGIGGLKDALPSLKQVGKSLLDQTANFKANIPAITQGVKTLAAQLPSLGKAVTGQGLAFMARQAVAFKAQIPALLAATRQVAQELGAVSVSAVNSAAKSGFKLAGQQALALKAQLPAISQATQEFSSRVAQFGVQAAKGGFQVATRQVSSLKGQLPAVIGIVTKLRGSVLVFASSTISAMAPVFAAILPFLPIIAAVGGAVLLLTLIFKTNFLGIRSAVQFTVGVFEALFNAVLFVLNPLNVLQAIASGVANALSGAAQMIQGAWEGFSGWFGGMMSGLVGKAVEAGQGLINALNHSPTVWIPIAWDKAIHQIGGGFVKLVSNAASSGNILVRLLSDAAGMVSLSVSRTLSPIAGSIRVAWESTLGGLFRNLGNFLSNIANSGNVVTGTFNAMSSVLTNTVGRALNHLIWSVITFGATSVFSFSPVILLLTAVGVGVYLLSQNFLGLRSVFVGVMLAISGAFEGLAQIVSGVSDVIQGVFQALTSLVRLDFEGMREGIAQVFLGVRQIFDGAASVFRAVFQGAVKAVEGLFEGLGQVVGTVARVIGVSIEQPRQTWESFVSMLETIEAKIRAIGNAISNSPVGKFIKSATNVVTSKAGTLKEGTQLAEFDQRLAENQPKPSIINRLFRQRQPETPAVQVSNLSQAVSSPAPATLAAAPVLQTPERSNTQTLKPSAVLTASALSQERSTKTLGAASEAANALTDIVSTVNPVLGGILSGVFGLFSSVTSLAAAIPALVAGLSAMGGVAGLVSAGFTALGTAAASAWAAITGPLLPVVAGVGLLAGAVFLLYQGFQNNFLGIRATIESVFGFFNQILQTTAQTFNSVVGGITTGLNAILQTVLSVFQPVTALFGGYQGMANGLAASIANQILLPLRAIAFVASSVIFVASSVISVVGGVVQAVLAVASVIIGVLVTPLRFGFMLVASVISGIGRIIQNVQALFGGMLSVISAAFSRIAGVFSQVRQAISSAFTPLFGSGGQGGIGQALEFIANLIANVLLLPLQLVAGILTAIFDTIKAIATVISSVLTPVISLLAIPFQVIGAIVQGIVSAINSVGNFLSNIPFLGGLFSTSGGSSQPSPPPVQKFSTGGIVAGSGTTDSIPALVTPGEFVVNPASSRLFAPLLEQINNGASSLLEFLPPIPIPIPQAVPVLAEASAGSSPDTRPLQINFNIGEIKLGGSGTQDEQSMRAMAMEFLEIIYPQLQRAVVDILRNDVEKTR